MDMSPMEGQMHPAKSLLGNHAGKATSIKESKTLGICNAQISVLRNYSDASFFLSFLGGEFPI